jgi:anti-anti-sigma factor
MAATFEQDPPILELSLRFADAAAFLRLDGEIDSAARPILAGVAIALHDQAPATIFVDLGGVSFAGTALITFLDRLTAELPGGSTVVLCRPAPATACLIQLTHIDTVVEVDDDLPAAWPPDPVKPAA